MQSRAHHLIGDSKTEVPEEAGGGAGGWRRRCAGRGGGRTDVSLFAGPGKEPAERADPNLWTGGMTSG